MRATVTTSSLRRGKRRLLASCAIGAGLAAIAYGGPALAQVAGSGTITTLPTGTPTPTPSPASTGMNPSTVNLTGAQSIINWVPTDSAATGGDIDFLPTGNTLTFNGSGNYVVLNRFVNGAGGSLSRQIALNGTINSTNSFASGAQGGSIWFYNAGGILIGSTGVINVGSLVLTTNDILTTNPNGLIDPATGIRFRAETAGSTAGVTISSGARINASESFAPAGSSYVALVAPRVTQAGQVDVNGSAAYVAAEEANIRINAGLFDINVLTGATGGQAITHTGITTGPEQQATGQAQRIYMVAIPKNVAVSMLVSGIVGFQDASGATVAGDGSIVLSAGYNIANGTIDATPTNATAANITINDIIFRSDVTAHASGDLLARPLQDIPPPPPPTSIPPPNPAGRLLALGNATFAGDASAALTVDTGHQALILGNLAVRSGGTATTPGRAEINVDGGSLSVGGFTSIVAPSFYDTATGDTQGGDASLTIAGGGQLIATAGLDISGDAYGGLDATGLASGDGRGGSATLNVTGAGSTLTSSSVNVHANGYGAFPSSGFDFADIGGDGVGGSATVSVQNGGTISASGPLTAQAGGFGGFGLVQSGTGTGGSAGIAVSGAGSTLSTSSLGIDTDSTGGGISFASSSGTPITMGVGGNAQGGTATLAVTNGGGLSATNGVNVTANGSGELGTTQSGNGTGGTARVTISGPGTVVGTPLTVISAAGTGGGSVSLPSVGTFFSANGGDSTGGTAELLVTTDTSSSIGLGDVGLSVSAFGGGAGNAENTTGGGAIGGTANISIDGNGTAFVNGLSVDGRADGGDAYSTSGTTAMSGNARGGNVNLDVAGGSTLMVDNGVSIDVSGVTPGLENAGSGSGGIVRISAANGGVLSIVNNIFVYASGGSQFNGLPQTAGDGSGGTVDFLADTSGSITAGNYGVYAQGRVANVTTTNGTARGGNVSFTALNGGSISATSNGVDYVDTSAQTGYSQNGGSAFGGNINILANEGRITLANTVLDASGVSGGALAPGAAGAPTGAGGNILIRTGFDLTSQLDFSSLGASADGRTQAFVEGSGGGGFAPAGDGEGGSITFEANGAAVSAGGTLRLSADGSGGIGQGDSGRGGSATFTQIGGTVNVGDLTVSADGFGGGTTDQAGDGFGGTATVNFNGGVFSGGSVTASATGSGGLGFDGNDDPDFGQDGGAGGQGFGGNATINVQGDAVISAALLSANASGNGGAGGQFYSNFGSSPGAGGDGGLGYGGNAIINLTSGSIGVDAITADAGGFGGNGGGVFPSSSGTPNGFGVGGDGGTGQGGVATINVGAATVTVSESVTSRAVAVGGTGGGATTGGNGGGAFGGLAQAIVTNHDAGALIVGLDASALGGDGGAGADGDGGRGGDAYGGRGRVEANGAGAGAMVSQANFLTTATGGNGGDAGKSSSSSPATAGRGGDGGNGVGGAIEVVANDGGTVGFSESSLGLTGLGNGGNGGRGADNPGTIILPGSDGILDTPDDVVQTFLGGDGGFGGAGIGGTVYLIANGGTIATNGAPLAISVRGVSGQGGDGGVGSGGTGNCCTSITDQGGRVLFMALATPAGPGRITLGDTAIDASGGVAGRIEMLTDSSISMNSLLAEALGSASPTNNDTDVAPQGIFLAVTGGSIGTTGDLTLRTNGSIGTYAQAGGRVSAGGNLLMDAGDQIDLRHEVRNGNTGATVFSAGDLTIRAVNSISGASGTLVDATNLLTLATTGPNGGIGVDRLHGGNISISTTGAASVEHAEADNNFTATVGSFRTGLNSIITGGNIDINSVGAVDLGNSTAGGYVYVNGSSIAFNAIDAGSFVDLSATGATVGNEGINGGSINAGSSVFVYGNSVSIDTIDAAGYLSATATGGDVAIGQATGTGGMDISAQGDITGTYNAGGSVYLTAGGDITASARAIGEGFGSSSGIPTSAGLFVDAGGNVVLTNSAASGMVGVAAGGSASITGADAGEDILVLAGTTATLSNITAGDDIDVLAPGNINATNLSATGTGPDANFISYLPGSGFTILQGEGVAAFNGADITMTSANGSIAAVTLSAGDDITLLANNGTVGLNGATTLGLGTTSGGSNIVTQGSDTMVSGLNAFDDALLSSTGTVNIAGSSAAQRDFTVTAAGGVIIAPLVDSNSQPINTIVAGRDLTITAGGAISGGTSGGNTIAGGSMSAGHDLTLIAADGIGIRGAATGGNGTLTLTGDTGITAYELTSGGATNLDSANGAINVGPGFLVSAGPVSATGTSVTINGGGDLTFSQLNATAGAANVYVSGNLTVTAGQATGGAELYSTGDLNVAQFAAADLQLFADNNMTLGNISATNMLTSRANRLLTVNGVVTARNMSIGSGDITIAQGGRLGTIGTTQTLDVRNIDQTVQTFVGGTGTRNGYHIDAAELTQLFGNDITIFAPRVNENLGGFVASAPGSQVPIATLIPTGSNPRPDLIIDSFTMTAGSAGNIGASGSLTISTPGWAQVIGDIRLTGLSNTNSLNLSADSLLQVILGRGTIRLLDANNGLGGQLNLTSEDVVVATAAALTDIGNATTTNAVNTRLGQNDGITLDEGALSARGIRFDVINGVYVQNSGAGTDFNQRRGLTFGDGGLDILPESSSTRIVINGVQLGANGQVVGLDTIPLLTISGSAVGPNPATGALGFDTQSTFNGCTIANVASCSMRFNGEDMFPVQDVIKRVTGDDDGDGKGDDQSTDGSDGGNLPSAALITTRNLDPLSGEPLLDDPVTGAGNDDLWTPVTDTPQP